MQKTLTKLLMVFIAMLALNTVDAQHRCNTDHNMLQMLQNPDFAKAYYEKQEEVALLVANREKAPCTNPLIVPIVVHYESGSIPQQCMIDAALAQIEQLNLDFRSCNANVGDLCSWIDAGCTNFGGTAGADAMPEDGACIQFCLADQNLPAAETTIGGYAITAGNYSSNSQNASNNWQGYFNVYVGAAGGALGFVPFLGGANNANNTQGASVLTSTFGAAGFAGCNGVGTDQTFDGGATLSHEAGHWFGLEHTFSDNVADTPPQTNSNGGCPTVDLNNCTSSVGTDYSANFMDYVDDACMSNFSADQVAIMIATADVQGDWNTNSISCWADWQSGATTYSSCASGPCGASVNPPTAAFTASNNGPITICTGATADITFTDTSTGNPTSWAWEFTGVGVSPATSTAQNPTVTVSAGGTVVATLVASNANGGSTNNATQSITITEQATCTTFIPADGSSGTVCPGQCIGFFDQSVDNPTSWNWSFAVTGDLVLSLTSSTDQNPTVCIPSGTSGDIVATLTTSTGTATNTISITVDQNCTAGCLEATNYASTYSGAIYGAGQGQEGLLSGNNTYNDISKADSYDLTADFGICTPSSLTGATLCFAAVDAGVTGAFDVAVWDDNAGVPGAIIASVATDAAAVDTEVNTNGNACIFYDFSTAPVNLTGKFYVGITGIQNITGGYLGLITNTVGEHTAVTGWEQWEDATWNSYFDVWNEAFTHAIFLEILPGAPTVAINVSAPTGGFCNDGTPYTFSENADLCTAGAGTAEAYVWTVSDGQTSTTASADFAFTTAGSYGVELCVTGVSCETNCVTETITVVDCGGGGCNNFENYTGSLISGTYQAGVNITSNASVGSTETVVFNAGTDIDMTAGFCVEQGADFLAEIVACTPFTGNVTTQRLSTQNMTVTNHSFSAIKGQTFDTENGRLGKRYINQMKNVIINNINTGLKKAKK